MVFTFSRLRCAARSTRPWQYTTMVLTFSRFSQYTTMACQAGCVGFSTTNARPSIAPTFGVEGMMGTNPLTFGVPTDEEFPFVIDCATSVNQRGKIERYGREGKPTPPGQVGPPRRIR